jgi:excisionase family DNA binding protein
LHAAQSPTADEATRLLWSIPEAQYVLNVGRTTVYELVAEGELVLVKIGRRSFITRESVDAYVERLTEAATR